MKTNQQAIRKAVQCHHAGPPGGKARCSVSPDTSKIKAVAYSLGKRWETFLTSPSNAYRADIDGLRALAILLVVGFHAFPDSITGGFVGVDVFFVISGFLISSIIVDALASDRFSYFDFYVRRIRRIFPALLLVLIPSFAFGWYALLPHEFAQLERHLAAAAAFVSNFSLWAEAGYFDNSANTKPLQHLWSLAIEEQFYILWPLLLAFAWKRTKKLAALTAVIALASFSMNLWLVSGDITAAFYSPLSRIWELMAGGLLAQLVRDQDGRGSIRPNMQSTVGLGLILSAVFLLDSNRAFPGWWALLPTVGTFLVVGAGPGAWLNSKFLARPEMVLVGLISYPVIPMALAAARICTDRASAKSGRRRQIDHRFIIVVPCICNLSNRGKAAAQDRTGMVSPCSGCLNGFGIACGRSLHPLAASTPKRR
ncbi:MAG: hypothetical protein QOC84_2056 [Bradyrhizobium sp.]|nr:hypothetical protein [Bradyrhizobium sp.]